MGIFSDAVRLGDISGCQLLKRVDYGRYLDLPLNEIRRQAGLEEDLLLAYSRSEKKRHPRYRASWRLLDRAMGNNGRSTNISPA